jgi:hypothetical protein
MRFIVCLCIYEIGCLSWNPVDIIWSLPNEAGPSATASVLQLVSAVAEDLKIGPTFVKVGRDFRLQHADNILPHF